MHCPNCGKETDGKFCQFCGAPLPQADGPSETAPPAARRKPWLPVAAAIGAAAIVAGAFVFWHNRPASVPAVSVAGQEPEGQDPAGQEPTGQEPTGQEPEKEVETSVKTEETGGPVEESNLDGVSADAYWKGMAAIEGFDEAYWKKIAVDVTNAVFKVAEDGDPIEEYRTNMAAMFAEAPFVKTAQESICAITDETSGGDYDWERFIAMAWLLKAEGRVAKSMEGEEGTPKYQATVASRGLKETELEYGDLFFGVIQGTNDDVLFTRQEFCEIAAETMNDAVFMDNMFDQVITCGEWLGYP